MPDLLDYEIFARVVSAGSLSAAGRELRLSPAVISRRLTRLEERLGARLLQRTTRCLTLTEMGQGFHERVVAVLASVEDAETFVTGANSQIGGVLKMSAPTSFGRLHVAPLLSQFLEMHPGLKLDVELNDEFVDLVGGGYDLAVRIGALTDSSMVARRLAPNRRIFCAAPRYLDQFGEPKDLDDLHNHRLLAAAPQIAWKVQGPGGPATFKAQSMIQTNSSEVVRSTLRGGLGIGFRSTWDVSADIADGVLRRILHDYEGPADVGIYAIYPTRRLVPTKVRAFVDFLSDALGPHPYWDQGLLPPR